MSVTISAQNVITQVNAELEAIEGFQKNIDQHMDALLNAQEEDHIFTSAARLQCACCCFRGHQLSLTGIE